MDNNTFFKQVLFHLEQELPLVVYRKPNENIVQCLLQNTNNLCVGNTFNKQGFVFSPFEEINKNISVWLYEQECKKITLNYLIENSNIDKEISTRNSDSEAHITIINKAIKQLQLGNLQKVVVSRSEFIDFDIKEPVEWFKNILNIYSNTFCYLWYHPKVGMWLGATPETLIALDNNKFNTMALAGTMPYNGTKDVAWGAKEKEEQQLVVDSILEGLKPVTKQVEKGITLTQKAGSLLHLKTNITGELLKPGDLKVLIDVLHPTSAVCGLPKEDAKKFILDNENYNRSYYTGYLGSFSPVEKTHLFVNLRCMQIHDTKAEVYVGGGITALSNAEAEWQETVNKSSIMKTVL